MVRTKKVDLNADEIFKDWSDWVETIYNEAISLAHNRAQFRRIAEIFKNHRRLQKVGGHIWEWIRNNYVAAAAMSLRRELDKQAGTRNLRHLLHEIKARPNIICRARYREMWSLDGLDKKTREFQAALREKTFNKFQLVKDPKNDALDHIDPKMIVGDIQNLDAQTDKVRTYVEQVFAHRTGQRPSNVTFDEFDAAVDAIQEKIKKYYLLIIQSSVSRFEPVPQFDIDAPFRFPWMPRKRNKKDT